MSRYNLRPAPGFGRWLVSITLFASVLQAATITPGAPGSDGSLDLHVTLPDGSTKDISVPIKATQGTPPVATTAAQKATAIFNALSTNSVPNLGYIGATTVSATGSKIEVTGDTTTEVTKVADSGLSLPGSPAYATLGFDGPLTAIGTDGAASVFTASFGVDGSTYSSASLTYGQLTSATDNGLATALYDTLLTGLSSSLQADLHLDLSTDSITFDFPSGSGEYFVQTSTTSPGTSQFMSVVASPTPEPLTLLSLGAGLILIGMRRKRSGTDIE